MGREKALGLVEIFVEKEQKEAFYTMRTSRLRYDMTSSIFRPTP